MKFKKLFKKEDGTRYELTLKITSSFGLDRMTVDYEVDKCPPGKRKFVCITDHMDDYSFRKLSLGERPSYKINKLKEENIPDEWWKELISEALDEMKATMIECLKLK